MKVLQLNEVSQYFGDFAAVEDVGFEVEEGEIFGIAGPNGAGKTTLFNVISGHLPGSGEILLDGTNIAELRPYQICHKGLARTFQIPQLFSSVSVFDNVRVGTHFGDITGQDEEENIQRAIHFVGLDGKEKVVASNLNLYDKKLTMLAAALAADPKVLMLDEPIGGLSPREVKNCVDLFREINKDKDMTLIIIEHLMKVLMDIAKRLMILHYGKKICLDVPNEVAKNKRVIEAYLGEGA